MFARWHREALEAIDKRTVELYDRERRLPANVGKTPDVLAQYIYAKGLSKPFWFNVS